jgi:glycogen debranching enzyme
MLQELGASNSSYSLSNQHKLNPVFNNNTKEIDISDVQKFVAKLRNEWKVQQAYI